MKRGNPVKNIHSSFEFHSCTSVQVQCHFCARKCYLPMTEQWRKCGRELLPSIITQLEQGTMTTCTPVGKLICHRDPPVSVRL